MSYAVTKWCQTVNRCPTTTNLYVDCLTAPPKSTTKLSFRHLHSVRRVSVVARRLGSIIGSDTPSSFSHHATNSGSFVNDLVSSVPNVLFLTSYASLIEMVRLFNFVVHFRQLHHNRNGTTDPGWWFDRTSPIENLQSHFHICLPPRNDDQRLVETQKWPDTWTVVM